jgi:hypothetical protein
MPGISTGGVPRLGGVYMYVMRQACSHSFAVCGVWCLVGRCALGCFAVWEGSTSCLVTGFSWHGKKKEKPTGLDTSTGFVPASLPTTAGVAEGVSRFSGTSG